MSSNSLEVLLKNNRMIKAKYEFTPVQNRIIQRTFLDVQKSKMKYGMFTLEEMKKITNNTGTHNINSIELILKQILDNDITQVKENGDWVRTKVIAGYRYIDSEKKFEVALSPMFLDMVLEYKEDGFTAINVTKYSSLVGSSSQHLYELLRMWTGAKNIIEYKVKDIREYLYLTDKYKEFNDFKRRVIEASVKDINKQSLMNIHKVEYVKKGKRIDSIKFYVKDLEPRTYNFKSIDNKVDSDGNIPLTGQIEIEDFFIDHRDNIESDLATRSKLSLSTIKKLIGQYSEEEVKIGIDILVKAQGITARLKYLQGILKKKKEETLNKVNIVNKQERIYSNPVSKTRFNNYKQREYDYEKLENELLGWD